MVEHGIGQIHTEHAVLDIGQDVGALIIYTREELLGREIEISMKGNDLNRIHTVIHERRVNKRRIFAGLFLALPAGDYIIRVHPGSEVTIIGGQVVELNWCETDIRHSFQ